MKELRKYQEEAVEAVFNQAKTIQQKRKTNLVQGIVLGLIIRVLVVMATGLGKTVIAARVAREWRTRQKTRVLFMMHMTDALHQARAEFEETLKGMKTTTGLFMGEIKENLEADILFATFQTMSGNLDLFDPQDFGLIVIDEAHHGQAETYREVIKYFEPDMLYGMTATPDRSDGLDIRDIFGKPIFKYGLAEALRNGRWLAQVNYRMMTDNISRQKLRALLERVKKGDRQVSLGDINRTIFLQEKIEAEVAAIRQEQGVANKQTIIFCKSVSHAREVARHFPKGKAYTYHTSMSRKAQKERLAAFQNDEFQTIIVVDKFNEAIDIPSAELIVFLRSTDSKTIWLQQLGRGLRRTENKNTVTILDFVGSCQRLLDIQDFNVSITGSEPNSATEVITTDWNISYTEDLVDVIEILELLKRDFYPTWKEASAAAYALGITGMTEYNEHYREDPRLPSKPYDIYAEVWKQNGGWRGFLGNKVINFYPTWKEASAAACALSIKGMVEYRKRYKEDPRLPSKPHDIYADVWKQNGGWRGFLGTKTGFYPTWEKASAAAHALSIKTKIEYTRRYREDLLLPSNPDVKYSDTWQQKGGWKGFLGTDPYPTWKKASAAARALGIKSQVEYKKRYREDLRLPSHPYDIYTDVWKQNGGWRGFLGNKVINLYPTWKEASAAARALGIKIRVEYQNRYKEDPRLPSNPRKKYLDVWKKNGGWRGFLGKPLPKTQR